MKELKKAGHPAKQVFQAIRIEVNDELNALKEGLNKALDVLSINGRVAVISFHSLEDKIVKNIFRERAIINGNRINDFKLPDEIALPSYDLVNRKVIVPTEEEILINHRSKSAKLQIIEKVR